MATRQTYVPKDWNTGDIIQESDLDHIEQGIYNVDNEIAQARGEKDTLEERINTLVRHKEYNTLNDWSKDYPNNRLSDIPVNKVVCIANTDISPIDTPVSRFIGNVLTVCASSTLKPGAYQVAVGRPVGYYFRYYIYSSSGNYWSDWHKLYDASSDGTPVTRYRWYISLDDWLADFPNNKLADIPINRIISIGNTDISPTDKPVNLFIGNVLTVCANSTLQPGAYQIAVGRPTGYYFRYYIYASNGNYWSDWHKLYDAATDGDPVTCYKFYNTRNAWLADFPSDKLGDIPVNKIIAINDTSIDPSDKPERFYGTIITFSSVSTLQPGACQFLTNSMGEGRLWQRCYYYSSTGNYWGKWQRLENAEQEYHVGSGQTYTSFTSLLLDLKNNGQKKVIYIHDGEYDVFSEYVAEVANGRLTVPPDNINASDYESYNAFVPNNTRIVGLGNVTLSFEPTVAQLEALSNEQGKTGLGASYVWSPLNIYGSVEIENVTIKGHNCRYCMHNDDHNTYPNAKQHYKNCRFLYRLSDMNSAGTTRFGYNYTIGFGIQNSGTHIFDDCEIYMDTTSNIGGAYYGHESGSAKNGTLLLRNCIIHSSDYSCSKVIKLQNLATSQGKVEAIFKNCYINGGLNLDMNYTTSKQNFDVTFINCNKVPVTRTISSGGTITDIYTVKWYNPLSTPTAQNPLYEENSY